MAGKFHGIPNPTDEVRREINPGEPALQGEGGLEGHLRFAEGFHSIYLLISAAVFGIRTAAVPLHGKIPPARTADDAVRE